MKIQLIDKSGFNYLVFEFNLKLSVFVISFKRWLHVKRAELRQGYIKWRYDRFTETGKGHYVWKDGCWVSGKVINRSIWHTFFDYGMSRWVDSSKVIRDHEKEGHIYTTYQEAERETAKKKFQIKMEHKAKTRRRVEQALEEVSRGRRSYAREIEAQIPGDMKLRQEREQAARLAGLIK